MRPSLAVALPAFVLTYLCLSAIDLSAQSYTFTALVGSVAGTNDGINSSAQFDFPSGIAVDRAGNLFVADTSNNTIRKVSPAGPDWVVTTIVGVPALGGVGGTNDGINNNARFWKPNGVAVDTNGNIFVVDHYTHTIRKITPSGTNWVVSTIAGVGQMMGYADGTNSDARFSSPTGIAIDKDGNLIVSDTFTYTIRKITPVGTNWVVTTIAGGPYEFGLADGTNSEAQFNLPFGLTVDRSNNIFVADFGNDAIRKISPDGTNWVVTTIAGSGATGTNDGPNTSAQFNSPADIVLDSHGNLFVTDQFNHSIRKITPAGTNWVVSTIGGTPLQFGTNNGIGTSARFRKPWGLAINSNDCLFIADYSNQLIREGVASSTSPPRLSISLGATNIVLAWPLSASSFTLESTASLRSPIVWSPVTNAATILRNNFTLLRPLSIAPAFFRLRGS